MRRKDRAMGLEFGLEVIDRAPFGVLSLVDDTGAPYGIPLSIAREHMTLYFHSAMAGKKVDILAKNPAASISFVGDVHVPENYTPDELDEIVQDPQQTTLLLSKVFTTEFESALVTGFVKQVRTESEKLRALRLICQKYTPSKMAYFTVAAQAGAAKALVYKLEISELTAKRKKYDQSGEELKWGRLE